MLGCPQPDRKPRLKGPDAPRPRHPRARHAGASVSKPLCIDLFCGLGGFTAAFLAEGWDCVGFDIERHVYGSHSYPSQLVIQDVLTLHGSQFKDAGCIVCSPPCQEYSYMAMPWKLAKAKAAAIRADTTGAELERLNRLFNACFRIQAQASLAAGRHIPLIVENVRGAIPWVGRSRFAYGSYHFWGDVPALMPLRRRGELTKIAPAVNAAISNGQSPTRWTNAAEHGVKLRDADGYERSHPHALGWKSPRTSSGNTNARKAASAMIAKIPPPVARHIARAFR